MKKKTKKSKLIKFIIFYSICLLIGYAFGRYAAKYIDGEVTTGKVFFAFAMFIVSFCVFTYCHIILHELGHLVFGLLTGYKFSSFRIGKTLFVKTQTGLKRKKMSIPNTGGQCLMIPPSYREDYPYQLYLLGGVLMNLVTIVLAFPIFYYFREIPFALTCGFFLSALILLITNALPFRISGMDTDGKTVLDLRNNSVGKRAIWLQLYGDWLQSNGKSLELLPHELLEIPSNFDFNNAISCSLYYIVCTYYFQLKEFVKFRELLNQLLSVENKILPFYRNELLCELIFLDLLTSENNEEIEKYDTEELIKYIQKTSFFPSKQRFLYAYELLENKNIEKSDEHLRKFNEIIKTWPYEKDIQMEKELISLVGEKVEQESA